MFYRCGSVAMDCPRFRVEFYSYSSLLLTIRGARKLVTFAFPTCWLRAPLAVLESAPRCCGARLSCAKLPGSSPRLTWSTRAPIARVSRMNTMRRGRVRLAATSPLGVHFNLETLFYERTENILQPLQTSRTSAGSRRSGGAIRCYDPGPIISA